MKLVVEGVSVSLETITFSEKGFGKYPAGKRAAYVLEVDPLEFAKRLSKVYVDCMAELGRDDELVGRFHPPFPGATSYPSLNELLEMPETQRMEVVDAYLAFDILRAYVQEDAAGPSVKWTIKSLDSVSKQEGVIVIEGQAAPI